MFLLQYCPEVSTGSGSVVLGSVIQRFAGSGLCSMWSYSWIRSGALCGIRELLGSSCMGKDLHQGNETNKREPNSRTDCCAKPWSDHSGLLNTLYVCCCVQGLLVSRVQHIAAACSETLGLQRCPVPNFLAPPPKGSGAWGACGRSKQPGGKS